MSDVSREEVTATERECRACGHDLANHYEDSDVRWCTNCDRPCEPQRGDGGGSESQVAPGRLADEERSAPPPPADREDAAARSVTVYFRGGPWDGQRVQVERVVGPVFGAGHETGNHYWLDTKSGDTPTYYWFPAGGGPEACPRCGRTPAERAAHQRVAFVNCRFCGDSPPSRPSGGDDG